MEAPINQFLWGMLAMAALVATLLFLRSGARPDRLFAFFAAAFAIFALNWIGLGVSNPDPKTVHYSYLLRLSALVLWMVATINETGGCAAAGTVRRLGAAPFLQERRQPQPLRAAVRCRIDIATPPFLPTRCSAPARTAARSRAPSASRC